MKQWKTHLTMDTGVVRLWIQEHELSGQFDIGGSIRGRGFSCLSDLSKEDIETLIVRLEQERAQMVKLEMALKESTT